ncbi:MAG TPA: GNAT family N-acetyltransferase [Bacteroidota bacterium]
MNELSLRRAGPDDCEAIRGVLLTTWLATYAAFVPEADLRGYFASAYSPGALTARMAMPGVQITLAEKGGSCVGVMITTPEPGEDRLAVNSLYVLPEVQGRGIGARLLGEAEARARREQLHALWLGVMKQNVRSVEWYRRAGFRFDREEPFLMGKTSIMHLLGSRPVRPEA